MESKPITVDHINDVFSRHGYNNNKYQKWSYIDSSEVQSEKENDSEH
jgi:hypothetical protein